MEYQLFTSNMNVPSLFAHLIKIIKKSSVDEKLQNQLVNEVTSWIDEFEQQYSELEELQKNFVTLETLLNTTKEAVFSFKPGGTFDRMNSAAIKLLQLEKVPLDSITAEDTLPALLKLLKDPDWFLLELDKIAEDNTLALEGLITFKDGREFEYYSLPKIHNNEYQGRIWCWRDISEIRRKDDQLEHLAFHDSLTDLPNKSFMMESLEHAISLAKRNQKVVSLFFIDLDDFKKINDTAGHKQGDNFLIAVAKRIKSCIRESDTFGRIGGDEFLIIIEDLENLESVKQTYRRILDGFKLPLDVGEFRYYVSCSIGISQFPKDGAEPNTLIRQADMAMYQAKQKGKNTYCFYHPRMARSAINALNIENLLRHAIKEKQLYLKYQPEINVKTNRVVGMEALVRWELPDGTEKSPEEFIAIAEKSGLINDLTKMVLDQVCKAIRKFRGTHLEKVPVSVNLSGKDLQEPSFSADVIAILEKHRVPGKCLIFEITESIFLEGISSISQVVNDLKNYGIRFAIDDFGTGYSSFRYLQLIDIDFIKIDKSFIHLVDNNPQQAAITRSIIDIGLNLNVDLVAEGIQNIAELKFVKATKCHIIQGNYISPPLTIKQLLEFEPKN